MPRTSQQYCCAFQPQPIFRLLLGASRLLPSISCSLLPALCLLVLGGSFCPSSYAQSSTATLSGTVEDQKGALIAGASIALINADQGSQRLATTNSEGTFVFPLVPPGRYSVTATREGFAPVEIKDVVLNVNDQVALKIHLNVGTVTQAVEIVDGASLIDESPAVATVIDRQFVANLPLNGRSFQSLVTLTPGVVLTKSDFNEPGQFAVNGQRGNANYFTVDGVSANAGISPGFASGQTAGGTVPALSAAGGTNNLVSVDALQEFKIQTSTYAPEFGRTPGAQVQIVTRSGTNNLHGTLFEFFRNDALDATDWFANAKATGKPPMRQNDFGFVLGGPVLLPRFGEGGRQPGYDGRNRTFFFFSYEGLRLRQPVVGITEVPTLTTRQNAVEGVKPFLNAFPIPTGPPKPNGLAESAASFSNPSTLNATSIRVDHSFNPKLTLFARYNYAPSSNSVRGPAVLSSLNTVSATELNTQTLTLGTSMVITPSANNDLRMNYSRYSGAIFNDLDNFGGAVVPSDSTIFPSFTSRLNGLFDFFVIAGTHTQLISGSSAANLQRQINFIDNLSFVTKVHQPKFGVDYRRLSPVFNFSDYSQVAVFNDVTQAAAGTALFVAVSARRRNIQPLIANLSLYGQDTWRASDRLTLTYGLRYEVNPPPSERNGNEQFTVTGLNDPSTLALAPRGTRIYEATYNNFAPRIGAAYDLTKRARRETVLRGGFGVFYDTGNGQAMANFSGANFPFTATTNLFNLSFPVSAALATPPAFNLNPPVQSPFVTFDPNLKLPYTYQWNFTIEQSLGSSQTVSASYVGAAGRRLLRRERLINANSNFPITIGVIRNTSTSDYHALQLQYQRHLSRGLQAIASYTWSKSLDMNSNDSSSANTPAAKIDPRIDRGPSDFDVRHAFSGAMSYSIPAPDAGVIGDISRNWSVDSIVTARSATPVNVTFSRNIGFGSFPSFRPDLVPGIPLYLDDPIAPGGKRFNNTRVVIPGNPNPQIGPFLRPLEARQGTLGRNVLRGFPVYQVDLSLRRQFSLTEQANLRFGVDFFNIFNHPNFAEPIGTLTDSNFGLSTSMLGRSLGSGGAQGGFNPLYQIGGPRSIQFSLKLQF